MNAPATDDKIKPPKNMLYRSRIEICRVLQALAKEHCSIYAEIGNSWTFISKIIFVDPHKGCFAVSYCANKLLNKKLLKLPSLTFTASYQDTHLEFECLNPIETLFENQPAIQLAMPETLISSNRREHPRIPTSGVSTLRCITEAPVSAVSSLCCVAEASGVISFESRISDVSRDGLGCMLYDCDIRLDPGTVLKGCRIFVPNGKAVVADLELRNTTTVNLPDGTLAHRVGLRFIQRPDKIATLINFFNQELDKN